MFIYNTYIICLLKTLKNEWGELLMSEYNMFKANTPNNKLCSSTESNQSASIDFKGMAQNREKEMNKAIEDMRQLNIDKKLEELRRHNEIVAVGQKQVENLEKLLADSNNAIEQRNAIIRFMVEGIINSQQPKEDKRKLLIDILVPMATVLSGTSDLVQFVKDGINALD